LAELLRNNVDRVIRWYCLNWISANLSMGYSQGKAWRFWTGLRKSPGDDCTLVVVF